MGQSAEQIQIVMKRFKVFITPRAHDEIQQGIDYYNEQVKGLGKKFHASVKETIVSLRKFPFHQIRYDDVRCLLVKKYPYILHYTLHEKDSYVILHAVIHTSLNPDENWL